MSPEGETGYSKCSTCIHKLAFFHTQPLPFLRFFPKDGFLIPALLCCAYKQGDYCAVTNYRWRESENPKFAVLFGKKRHLGSYGPFRTFTQPLSQSSGNIGKNEHTTYKAMPKPGRKRLREQKISDFG